MDFIPISQPSITKKEIAFVTDAVKSGWISSIGKYINIFEKSFAEYCGTKYAIATSNGTTALHLILAALNISNNDEVIIPDLTFVATANAVRYTGALPFIVDIDEDTLCIDSQAIRKAITPKTKAIIPVHLYGHPANMIEICKIAQENNLIIIEDAAEAHGAEINGKRVGSFGLASAFSFYGNKIITSGEGGMITTDDEVLFNRCRFLRDHAMSEKRYWHTDIGFNYRMTNLQAALGAAQLERIDELKEKKNLIFKWYLAYLSDFNSVKLNYTAEWAKNAYWMVCVEINNFDEKKRDNFISQLKDNGIDSRPFFYPISDMPFNYTANTPVAHNKSKIGLNLPSFFDLKKDQVEYICKTVKYILSECFNL
jgi:perosamine synthetase